ncbi:NAD(P)H-dependent oxidoreductase [Streptococcus chenjunshii]|uniref:NAD(P)H-dependent oxidoreductase n=1 Tax=Streptococcus chenjunshii TaxID=2173853 RepID=A0A372KM26_9STRE|nr:NAD(P)H-dependent oxidoreductase [Streptococcus chenjunshii]AXQ79097.1 NAD(P)H-dependent oxidoreductase [Streptococcus chenjunshii]RFU50292.1 NAD(P)H-dependent oxidoreductase [Streptococcus chenjunshii]RFU53323.1 NAD(P)H-dependent oxidoreductase [Streptococcus chenjunshii]
MTTKEDIKKQVRAAFDFRMAVRVYSDQKIPQEDLDYILDTAWLSPSSIGLEAWRFIVLEDKNIKEALKDAAWGAEYQLETASHFILLIAEKNARYDTESVKNSLVRRGLGEGEALAKRLATYESFQKNDMKTADNPRALFDWTAKQTYIALGNMMTAAAMIGIDSCPIEGFNYAKVNDILAQHGLINQEKEGIASMLSLGYRLRDPKHPRSRKPRSEVIFYDHSE